MIVVDCFLIDGRPARLLERPSCPRDAIIVVVVSFSLLVVVAVAAISQHHKLLLNPGTFKLSTDPLMAEVMLGPCRDIGRFGGDIGRFGVGWSEMEQDLRGADRLSREFNTGGPRVKSSWDEELHYTRN